MLRGPVFWAAILTVGTGVLGATLSQRLVQTAATAPQPSSPKMQSALAGANLSANMELKADQAGHFFASPSINGVPVTMIVDTGATMIALSYEDAQRAFLPVRETDFIRTVETASGMLRVAPVRIPTLTLGPIYMTQVEALVLPRGAGQTNLLGMNFLKRLSGFEVKSDRLIMRP